MMDSGKALIFAALLFALPAQGAEQGSAAAPSAGNGEERILPDKEQERMMALAASQQGDTEVLWLETATESFLGLFQPANRPQPRGGVLLLPHDRTSPDWPGSMQTLRRGLPDKGWMTLAIALPDQPDPLTTLVDASAAERSAEPANPLPPHAERVSQRIERALETLRERGAGRIYLVGEGTGGYWAAHYLGSHLGQRLYPVLIDPERPPLPELPPLPKLIEPLNLPVIDLYHAEGIRPGAGERQARLRLNAARRAGYDHYLSVRMPPRMADWRQTDPRLLSLVSGLINRHTEKLLAERARKAAAEAAAAEPKKANVRP